MNIPAYIVIGIICVTITYAFIKKMMITQFIIIANCIIFLITFIFPETIEELAFRPSYLGNLTKIYTLFTSLFLHSIQNIGHIIMNMVFLFLIGVPFEQKIGKKKFLLIYVITGICAIFAYSFLESGNAYLIGASGAIFGVLGAFAVSYPFKKILVPIFAPIILFLRIPVIAVAILYASIETLFTFAGVTDGTAHSAHLGGFISGVFLLPLVQKRIEEKKTSLEEFRPFLVNEKQKEIFSRAQQSDEPEIREAWLSYLKKLLKCPNCKGDIKTENSVYCEKCGYNKK
jgi:membrane associated rhomboid family serine protease